jgi:hypothetical protein
MEEAEEKFVIPRAFGSKLVRLFAQGFHSKTRKIRVTSPKSKSPRDFQTWTTIPKAFTFIVSTHLGSSPSLFILYPSSYAVQFRT